MASANPKFFTKSEISSMRVQPLREALAERGLGTSGNGTILKERLRDAIHSQNLSSSQNASASQSNVANVANGLDSPTLDIHLKGSVFTKIPKGSRVQATLAYIKLLENVISSNDKSSHEKLHKLLQERIII